MKFSNLISTSSFFQAIVTIQNFFLTFRLHFSFYENKKAKYGKTWKTDYIL